MIIHWLPLLAGLLLGLIPPRLLLAPECRYLAFEELLQRLSPSTRDGRRRRWWKLPLLWIDPVRGYVVAGFLMKSFTPSEEAEGLLLRLPLLWVGLLLFVMIWVQTTGRGHKNETLAPVGFAAAVAFAILPLSISLPVLILSGASTFALGSWTAGYWAGVIACAGLGFIYFGLNQLVATATVLIALPWVLSWLQRGRLVVPVRS